MFIDKALKKESKSRKIFYITMVSLGVFTPAIAYLSNIRSLFVWVYVIVLEILILSAILRKLNRHRLTYTLSNDRLRIKCGLFTNECLLFCDKIAIVHIENKNNDIEIIIVTTIKIRNKMLKPITECFIKRYPEVMTEYFKLKNKNPYKAFYFQRIKSGSLKKYILLDLIYKNCVSATFTSSAIEGVKVCRNQIEIKER